MQRGIFVVSTLLAFITVTVSDQRHCDPTQCNAKNHEVLVDCYYSCGKSCVDLGHIINCPNETPTNCKPGCSCTSGYLRLNLEPNSRCVPISKCPSSKK